MANKKQAKRDERIKDLTIAHIFLEEWGSTSYLPVRWKGYRYAITDYAPEWLSAEDLEGHEPDMCTTVLSVGDLGAPKGFQRVYSYQVGEKTCPCSVYRSFGLPHPKEKCPLCEGDGVLYWGEEWQVVVFAPESYTYGSGMVGCMYDNGPHIAYSKKDAIESLSQTFDNLPARALQRMRGDLKRHGKHYFPGDVMARNDCGELESIRAMAGADYCEISE
jgi:hypothetical protein